MSLWLSALSVKPSVPWPERWIPRAWQPESPGCRVNSCGGAEPFLSRPCFGRGVKPAGVVTAVPSCMSASTGTRCQRPQTARCGCISTASHGAGARLRDGGFSVFVKLGIVNEGAAPGCRLVADRVAVLGNRMRTRPALPGRALHTCTLYSSGKIEGVAFKGTEIWPCSEMPQ